MNIKVAIPTSDRIIISNSILNATYFKVFTISVFGIIHEEFREKGNIQENNLKVIEDCDFVLAVSRDSAFEKLFTTQKIEIVITDKKIITNAIVSYVNELLYKESNATCCP